SFALAFIFSTLRFQTHACWCALAPSLQGLAEHRRKECSRSRSPRRGQRTHRRPVVPLGSVSGSPAQPLRGKHVTSARYTTAHPSCTLPLRRKGFLTGDKPPPPRGMRGRQVFVPHRG